MSIGICFDDGFSTNYNSAEYKIGKKHGYECGYKDGRQDMYEELQKTDIAAHDKRLIKDFALWLCNSKYREIDRNSFSWYDNENIEHIENVDYVVSEFIKESRELLIKN